MELTQEKELEILKKILKHFVKDDQTALNEIRRKIGNIAKEIDETPLDVSKVFGPIFIQATAETFAEENFVQKKKN